MACCASVSLAIIAPRQVLIVIAAQADASAVDVLMLKAVYGGFPR